MKGVTVICFLICLFQISQCAKVLVVFPFPSPSHHRLGYSFATGLVKRGFEVTMVTPFQGKDNPKNFTEVILTGMDEEFKKMTGTGDNTNSLYDWDNIPAVVQLPFMNIIGVSIAENVLKHPNVHRLQKTNQKFDVVIIEQFANDALKMFAHYFNAPLIVFSSMGSNVWISSINGNPEPPSYVPDMLLSYGTKMTFFQRTNNFIMKSLQLANYRLFTYRGQEKLAKKYFPGYPDLDTIMYNASLVFLNSHESINIAVPVVPNMISIGGYHVSPPKALPKDLKNFMDTAKDGVIYFSLGSNLVPSDMPPKILATLLKVLGQRKEKVLWKWNQEDLPNKPANMMISKWFPQMDILDHPNLKLFITHCGLLSTTETIYHGVPILGLPVFGDQKLNAGRANVLGFGRSIIFSQITEENLKEALNDLLDNPRYKEMAQYRSRVFHDRPQKPMDLAAYWVDYVVRHRGAPHLRVAGLDLPWYQYQMLDVIAFLFVCVCVGLYVTCKLVKLCCCRKGSSKAKVKKN